MSAGFWAAALRVVVRGSLTIRTIILARLLVPDDFGLMAIATLSILLVERFTESGIDSALVQRRDDIRKYLNTAWTMQIVRSLVMAASLAIAAPFIAGFFNEPDATSIIRILSIGVLLKGFTNIGAVFFVKELRFDRYFILELSGKGLDVVVSIAYALVYPTVWALVFGVLAGTLARLATSYMIHDYRPRLEWIWDHVKKLFDFGKWILVSNIINYASGNLDDLMVGRALGIQALGFYRMAYNFSQAVATEVTQVTNQVAFPTYSKIQNSLDRLRTAYMGSLHLVSFIGFPLAVGTILVAADFTLGVLGNRWEPIIVPLQLLSVAGLMRGAGATIGPLFQSQGRPDIPPRFALAKVALLAIFLWPAITRSGLEGAALVVAVTATITGVAALAAAFRMVRATASDIIQAIGFPALNTVVMSVAVLGARALMSAENLGTFVALSLVGIVAYLASVAFSMRVLHYKAPASLLARVRTATGSS